MKSILAMALIGTVLSFSACDNKDQAKTKKYKYICTMHPEIGSDKPGVCSKCGMELVERED